VAIATLRLRADSPVPLETKVIETHTILKDAVLFSNIVQSIVDFKNNHELC